VIEICTSAIDQDIGSIDEPRFVTSEKQRGVGDLFRGSEALAGQKLRLMSALLLRVGLGCEPLFGLRCKNEAGRNGIDPNATGRVLDREGAR
jgi:hypothetical protein